jgi:hypothetical protein
MDNFDHTTPVTLAARLRPAWSVREDVPCQGSAGLGIGTEHGRTCVPGGAT